jgi:peptide/nickel transport system substrate-binding protein
MNADAAKFSLEIFMDKSITPSYSRYAKPLKRIEKIDDYTINIHTEDPYPALLLTLYRVFVVPPKYWKKVGKDGFNQKPIGTGPFKLTEWVKDDRLIMDTNENFWGDLPKGIDRVIWKPVPDDTARAAGLETGEYDLIANMSATSVPRIEANPDLQLISAPSYRLYSIILSSLERHSGPLQDKRVRQALNYAVDKNSIIKNLFFGKAKPLQGQVLTEGMVGFNPNLKPYPYDPEKAKQLLAEAGYPDGFEVPFKFPSGRYAQDREVSEAVAGMIEKIGVKTKLIPLEPGEFLKQLRERELGPMAFAGMAPPPDPHFQISQYRSDWRYSYYQNPQLDKLIDMGMIEMDVTKREKIYHEATRLMYDEAVVLFLYQGVDFYGATNRLKNWMPTGDQRVFLYGMTLQN